MPGPEEITPGSPTEWLQHAISDLELAKIPLPPKVRPEALCFHAQQAAEKALKAVLIAHGTSVPKTHNLRTLIDLLPPHLTPPPDVQEAVSLTDYAVASRYPGTSEAIEEEDRQEAISLAEAVILWADQVIKSAAPS